MHHLKSPPIRPLVDVVGRLERAGIPCGLGGSGLLAALGLIHTVNDWDLTCDAEPGRVAPLLGRDRLTHHGHDALHADHKLMLSDERIEVICGFAFHGEHGTIRLACVPQGRWRGVPLASAETWAVAYTLLAEGESSSRRRERADLLFAHLARRGADPRVLGTLLEQPLPATLAARLRALGPRPTSSIT